MVFMAVDDKAERRKKRRKVFLRLFIILLLFSTAFAAGIIFLGPAERQSELSAYGDDWNDVSRYRKGIKDMGVNVSNIISSPTILDTLSPSEKKNTLFISLGVEKEYTNTEAWAIYNFYDEGGKVIIADDFGYGNSVSSASFTEGSPGFNIEFLGSRLWDNRYDKNPLFVKIPVNTMDFSGTILLNEPTSFEIPRNGEGMAYSSPAGASWVDLNDNGKRDHAESAVATKRYASGFPIIYELKREIEGGAVGRALFISDPSIFLNDMWDRENNSAFAVHLVRYLLGEDAIATGKANVLFDESRHYPVAPVPTIRSSIYSYIVLLLTDVNLRILTPVIVVMFLLILIIVVDNPPRLRHRFDIKHISLYNLRTPKIHSRDADRIRALFLEKIRLSSGMTMNNFKDLSAAQLAAMVGNNELAEFLLDWDQTYTVTELENLLVTVRDWKHRRFTRGDGHLD